MTVVPAVLRPLVLALAATLAIPAVELTVSDDRPTGVYQPGERVTWTVTTSAAADKLKYTVKSGGAQEVASGVLAFTDGKATVSATRDTPGTLLLGIPHDGSQSYGGAVFAWERIEPSAPEPADFDAFWKAKLAELEAVPVDAQLEAVESGVPRVRLWKITMGNIRGAKIHGYLARPEGDAPCPALLQVQWAGVYPLDRSWVLGPAKDGWLALNIIAHDLPVDESKDFYAKQNDGPLKGYPAIGNEDRDTAYFLRMYLSCYRAADYLVKRPDWNKAVLHVQGTSQGGLQTVVTAGLHPAVTDISACVPAGCDHTGGLVQRAPGWPQWINTWSGKDVAKMTTASTYYDVVNFARRVKCPALVGMGLIDTTCPPAGVFAMFNQIAAPKRIVIMPPADHKRFHNAYAAVVGPWLAAAKDGKPLPLK